MISRIAICGIVFIWSLAICMTDVMKRIAPDMKSYPVYAVFVASLFTLSTLLCVCKR